jgi:hypothetical protein
MIAGFAGSISHSVTIPDYLFKQYAQARCDGAAALA